MNSNLLFQVNLKIENSDESINFYQRLPLKVVSLESLLHWRFIRVSFCCSCYPFTAPLYRCLSIFYYSLLRKFQPSQCFFFSIPVRRAFSMRKVQCVCMCVRACTLCLVAVWRLLVLSLWRKNNVSFQRWNRLFLNSVVVFVLRVLYIWWMRTWMNDACWNCFLCALFWPLYFMTWLGHLTVSLLPMTMD